MKTYDLQRAAKFLHMSKSALRQKAKSGSIPGSKPAKKWVFVQDDLVIYLRSQAARIAETAKSRRGDLSCLSTNVRTFGGSVLPHQLDSEYANLLGLQTRSRRRSITTK